MKRNLLLHISILSAILCFTVEAYGNGLTRTSGGENMAAQGMDLPFGLRQEELATVEVMYGFYSAKSGAGKQEISIRGNSRVSLYMTRSRYDPPSIHEGKLDVAVVVRLLDLMEEKGFLGFQDHYAAEGDPHARRVLRLVLPHNTKTVMLDQPGFPAFEVVAGAVKLAAGLALPEALKHRFFPNL